MAVDVDRLTPGEQLVGVSGAALFVVSFLHWLGGRITSLTINGQTFSTGKYHFAHGAWGYTVTAIAVVIGLLEVAYVLARLAGLERPRRAGAALVVAGGLAFLLVVVQVLAGAPVNLAAFGLPSVSSLPFHPSFEKTRSAGAYAGLVASFGLAMGGVLAARED